MRISARWKASIAIGCMAFPQPVRAQQTSGPGAQTSRIAPGNPATSSQRPGRVIGAIIDSTSSAPVPAARVTLFTPGINEFFEVRSDAAGTYAFRDVPAGSYRLGVASPGRDYREVGLQVGMGTVRFDVSLTPETQSGSWQVIGSTLPHLLDATDIGALLPDGQILYCHDTQDPIVFNPLAGNTAIFGPSGSEQGCMNTTHLDDGSILFVGGQDGSDPGRFRMAISWVKRYLPNNTWMQLADMLAPTGRWYPGLARLSDGSVLVFGGGTAPNAQRTDTAELFDPLTQNWSWVGQMGSANEFAPAALLHNGLVLRTWGADPELFDPLTNAWSAAAPLAFANRGFPGHSDHSLLVLSDGRALVVGVRGTAEPPPAMTEYYDPSVNTFTAGSSPTLVRYQGEVVYLPNGEVFYGAGDLGTTAGPEPNVLGIVKRCDLFDPFDGSWRRVADMPTFREYHGVTLLIPDGRVVTTGGTMIKFQVGPTTADIEAYSPPYLFRGVRPGLSGLSDTTPARGQTLNFEVFPDTQLTGAVLMGMQTTTHWVDGGIPRRLELDVSQVGSSASVSLPTDANLLPLGWYMLFGMVDDIPSEALVLRVGP